MTNRDALDKTVSTVTVNCKYCQEQVDFKRATVAASVNHTIFWRCPYCGELEERNVVSGVDDNRAEKPPPPHQPTLMQRKLA